MLVIVDAGAVSVRGCVCMDARRGKGVVHISQERMEEWFRNVHAGQAMVLGARVSSVGREDVVVGGGGGGDG